jgi:hypothetical protein
MQSTVLYSGRACRVDSLWNGKANRKANRLLEDCEMRHGVLVSCDCAAGILVERPGTRNLGVVGGRVIRS